MDHRLACAFTVSQPPPTSAFVRMMVSHNTTAAAAGNNVCSSNANKHHIHSKCVRSHVVSCHAAASGAQAAAQAPSFEPSVWGDFFIRYEPRPSQQSMEWMRERANKLKEDVCTLFTPSKDIFMRMNLVDEIVHLGIDHLFEQEIKTALKDIHESEFTSSNLHEVALRFRLLREHGFWVSPDVFNKFKGDDGNFRNELADDPRGLLSLYNAAHLFIHGEPELEDAISFARNHLESMSQHSVLKAPLADQVKRALRLPLPRTHKRVEMLHFMFEYDQERHNPVLLELAKLDFNLLQHVHLKELKEISRWWKEVSGYMGLNHIRDRVIECYTWAYAVYHEEDLALARMIFC